MGEIGRYPMFIYVIKTMLKFYTHICERKETEPILAEALREDINLPDKKSWYKSVNKILKLFNVNPCLSIPMATTVRTLESSMRNSYFEYWKKSLGQPNDDSGKLYLYRKIKSNFHSEAYLSVVKKFKFRRALTSFRISVHNLEIETGRHANVNKKIKFVKREERYCKPGA